MVQLFDFAISMALPIILAILFPLVFHFLNTEKEERTVWGFLYHSLLSFFVFIFAFVLAYIFYANKYFGVAAIDSFVFLMATETALFVLYTYSHKGFLHFYNLFAEILLAGIVIIIACILTFHVFIAGVFGALFAIFMVMTYDAILKDVAKKIDKSI